MKTININGEEYNLPGSLNDFQKEMYIHLINWKWKNISKEKGTYKYKGENLEYDAILPKNEPKNDNLIYNTISSEIEEHRKKYRFKYHIHFKHMASSQAANINLFLPILLHSKVVEDCKDCNGEGSIYIYQIYTYSWHRSPKNNVIMSFDTQEEADDEIFRRIYEYKFQSDDQRDTAYFSSYDDAFDYGIEVFAGSRQKDEEIIRRYMTMIPTIEEIRNQRQLSVKKEWDERVDKLADIYAGMIERMPESYKETCTRLKAAIGEKIESSVFHAAVKKIRG